MKAPVPFWLSVSICLNLVLGCTTELAMPAEGNDAADAMMADMVTTATTGAGGSLSGQLDADVLAPTNNQAPSAPPMMPMDNAVLTGGGETQIAAAGRDSVGGSVGGAMSGDGGITGGTEPPQAGGAPDTGGTPSPAGGPGAMSGGTPIFPPLGGVATPCADNELIGTACQAGLGRCLATGTWQCIDGEASCDAVPGAPRAERCNQEDDDCDGLTDNGLLGCVCAPGTVQSCFPNALGAVPGVGRCLAGTRTCLDGGRGYGPCTGVVGPGPERCNGLDDDCNGIADDLPNRGAPCSVGLGVCARDGTYACDQGVSLDLVCNAAEGLPSDEICDELDNDCNGLADDVPAGCRCLPGASRSCFPADLGGGQPNVGICREGTSTCLDDGSAYGPCLGAIGPSTETCDGQDNDCNGLIDDAPSVGTRCTVGRGGCQRDGVYSCGADGPEPFCADPLDPQTALAQGEPDAEQCNGFDDNCNGIQDDVSGLGDVCDALGVDGQVAIGLCARRGQYTCRPQISLEPVCNVEAGSPQIEVCNGIDDDCDGTDDNVAALVDGDGELVVCNARWPGGDIALGRCANTGVLVCEPDAGIDPVCSVVPNLKQVEICNGSDDDCDGIDDNVEGLGDPCSALDQQGEVAQGACANRGEFICDLARSESLVCNAEPAQRPAQETCNGVDDDCDGVEDNDIGCLCLPGTSEGCYGGPEGTAGTGQCISGIRTCSDDGRQWGACMGEVQPGPEVCDGEDNDCNGESDDLSILLEACTATTDDGTPLLGICSTVGQWICDPENGLRCDAPVVSAVAEKCNGLDDDCNGEVDDGLDCPCRAFTRAGGEANLRDTVGQHTYYFCPNRLSWDQARAQCEQYDADLLIVQSAPENAFVTEKIYDGTLFGNTMQNTWMGLNDIDLEGYFEWVDGRRNVTYPQFEACDRNLDCGVGEFCCDARFCEPGFCTAQTFWNFEAFGTDEPNDYEGNENPPGEDCVHYWYYGNTYRGWNDSPCDETYASVCETKCAPGQDDDGDGYLRCGYDCDDTKANVHPGAPELPNDGIDNNCDNAIDNEVCFDETDNDGDGDTDEGCSNCDAVASENTLYLFCDYTRNWNDARGICLSEGMDLTIIDSLGEHEWIYSTLAALEEDDHSWHHGLNDIEAEGFLTWNGEQNADVFLDRPWREDGPQGNNNDSRDCGMLRGQDSGQWRMGTCSTSRRFICETIF